MKKENAFKNFLPHLQFSFKLQQNMCEQCIQCIIFYSTFSHHMILWCGIRLKRTLPHRRVVSKWKIDNASNLTRSAPLLLLSLFFLALLEFIHIVNWVIRTSKFYTVHFRLCSENDSHLPVVNSLRLSSCCYIKRHFLNTSLQKRAMHFHLYIL